MWKRVQQGLPGGQLSFLLRAGTDTLPTPLNLRRWCLKVDSICSLFGSKQSTIHHILSNCPEALQQGRYTWRHDCALQSLVRGLKDHLEPDMVLYADLPGMIASDNPQGTIPDSILVTSARSDIIIIEQIFATFIELTIPHNSLDSMTRAKERKSEKELYQQALNDLESKGFEGDLYTIKIGTLGHWFPTSRTSLLKASPFLTKKEAGSILDQAAKKVICASQIIFRGCSEHSWTPSRALL